MAGKVEGGGGAEGEEAGGTGDEGVTPMSDCGSGGEELTGEAR